LPKKPGVYFLKDAKGKVLYIGKAKSLRGRVRSYFKNINYLDVKTRNLVLKVSDIDYVVAKNELEAFLLEADLIRKYRPYYNISLKDDKRYPVIKIDKDKWGERVYIARKEEKDGASYFGPYPSNFKLKSFFEWLRKIFNYRSCKTLPKRGCIYYEMGLCFGVCVKKDKKHIIKYKKMIRELKDFLKGNTEKVIKKLEREKRKNIEKNNFEEAQEVEKKIEFVKNNVGKIYLPEDYINNLNLEMELREREMDDVLIGLRREGFLIDRLERVEGYDISQIGGQMIVGSMVVFEKGEVKKSEYRRFRVKSTKSDSQSLAEVLNRRLKHKEWKSADLIVLDGGRTQISDVYKKIGDKVNMISFEKDGDKIYYVETVAEKVVFKKVKGIKNQGVDLLKRVRDEAHLFAISYHKKVRKMSFDKELRDLIK